MSQSSLDGFLDDLIQEVKDPELRKDLIDRQTAEPLKLTNYRRIGEPMLGRYMHNCIHCGCKVFPNDDMFYKHMRGCGLE